MMKKLFIVLVAAIMVLCLHIIPAMAEEKKDNEQNKEKNITYISEEVIHLENGDSIISRLWEDYRYEEN